MVIEQWKYTFANTFTEEESLELSGSEDHLMPPSVQRSNAKHYKSPKTITEIKEYEGMPHLLPAHKGWEEVADYALAWAVKQAGWPPATSA